MENRKMKAWVLTEPEKLELQMIERPKVGDDQLLVKIERACSCNGSDPGIFHGHEAYQTPLVFGHEGSGEVVEVGKNIRNFSVGQRICWWFEMGAFAEYQAITPSKTAVLELPGTISKDEGPVMELVLAACRALMNYPAIKNRKKLLICGLGPSGLILLQYARSLGYEKIIGWDLYENRRKLASSLGIDEVYNPATINIETVKKMEQADISVVMMGDDLLSKEPTVDYVIRATRSYGTLITYGHPEHGIHFSPYLFQSSNLTMVAPENNMEIIREKGKQIVELVKEGKIRIEPLISHKVHFANLAKEFENLMRYPNDYMKVIYYW